MSRAARRLRRRQRCQSREQTVPDDERRRLIAETLDYQWSKAMRRNLSHASGQCVTEISDRLSTEPDRVRWILDDFRCALEDAEQQHDPTGFIGWLEEEADLTGYLEWIDGREAPDAAE